MPFSGRALDRDIRLAEDTFGVLPDKRRSVQPIELFGQRSSRLLLQNRNESFEATVFDRMKVDEVPAGRDGRVLERFEISPHVFEHRDDQIAGRSAVRFDGRAGDYHVSTTDRIA